MTTSPRASQNIASDAQIAAMVAKEKALLKKYGGWRTEGYLIETLEDFYLKEGYENWGWTVYRTCYSNEAEWQIYKDKFRELVLLPFKAYFDKNEAKERSKYLIFSFLEDRAQFENRTSSEMRAHYLQYLASGDAFKQRGISVATLERYNGGKITSEKCFEFFLIADAESIASVIDATKVSSEDFN
jgi:hypothetical protein